MTASTPSGRVSKANPGVNIEQVHRPPIHTSDEALQQLAFPDGNPQALGSEEPAEKVAVTKRVATGSGNATRGPKNPGKRRPSATGFQTILEHQAAGVPVEWVTAKAAPEGLLRYERETCVNFMETDPLADFRTSDLACIRRLEAMGIAPIKIVAFETGTGQTRYYQVPRRWIRRPYPPSSQPGVHKSADQWNMEGVSVLYSTGDFPKSERETSLSVIATEPLMEINTCDHAWQRRMENDGAKPEFIHVYEGAAAEFRYYLVPCSWFKRPAKSGKK